MTNYYKEIIRIWLKAFASAIVALFMVFMLFMICRRGESEKQRGEPPGYVVVDTVTYYDTIPYYLPVAKSEVSLGTRITLLPVFMQRDSDMTNGELRIENLELSPDSAAVEIPITQREYEGAEYHAWVSGYEPRLDSIFVFARRDVVTIREPRPVNNRGTRRWGIGVFAGYGVTPHGLQPCAGISINYNLWNF